jgi:hypothetical protein
MDQLSIPKKIHVGYNNRTDTYTGKLAYVIYTDHKGKVRKETSWNSWRDKKIDPLDLDNEPTSGFVLNKGVGGARGSWSSNCRNEYIRIYDPRGFEFEISVANLLFILGECNAFKGKGLEGEFVYAWWGTELVLLPVGCAEYKQSTSFTALQSMKVTRKEMKEGLCYKHKDTSTLVYMGRHKVRDLDNAWSRGRTKLLLASPGKACHVFYDTETKKWRFERGFTKLAQVVSQDSYPEFADLYTEFMATEYVSPTAKIVLSRITAHQAVEQKGKWFYIKIDGGYQKVVLTELYNSRYHSHDGPRHGDMTDKHFWPINPITVSEVDEGNIFEVEDDNRYYSNYTFQYRYHSQYSVSRSYIEDKQLFTPEVKLKSKKTLEVSDYVQRRKN